MTLQSSGSMTFSDIATELGTSLPLTLPSDAARNLAGKSSGGVIVPDGFYSKGLVTQTDARTSQVSSGTDYTDVSFGNTAVAKSIVVFAWHGDTSSNPGSSPTCSIAGGSATRIIADSDGTGSGAAIGTAIFTRSLTTETTGSVSVSWGGVGIRGIVVLRVVGYTMSSAHQTDDDNANSSSVDIDIPAKGLLVAVSGRRVNTTEVEFTGVTRRGSDVVTSARRNWGWDYNMSEETGRTVSFSPFSATNGNQSYIVASFSKS